MKYKIILVLLLNLPICLAISQTAVVNNAYQPGEVLTYRVYYSSWLGNFVAGYAEVKVESYIEKKGGQERELYHVTGTGSTKGFLDWFLKVRDKFESYIDPETLLPQKFVRQTREGSFRLDDEVIFFHDKGIAVSSRKTKPIPADVHDIVSAVFFLRTLDVDIFGPDSMYNINFFLDDSVYNSAVRFIDKGIHESVWGYLPTLQVAPRMAPGNVFSEQYPMRVWITDDDNKIPVFAESKIIIGSVKMELVDYSGLKSPFIKPVVKSR